LAAGVRLVIYASIETADDRVRCGPHKKHEPKTACERLSSAYGILRRLDLQSIKFEAGIEER